MRLQAGLLAARATGAVTRLAGRGGTSLPGKVLMRAEPHAIARLAARLPRGSVVVSATNGKTTTAAMVATILQRTGARLVHNRAGANMAGGVATALAAGRGDMGLFEVDEFWLGPVAAELEPRAVLLSNLFRDQLDRYGELEIIADRWAGIVAGLPGRHVARAERRRPAGGRPRPPPRAALLRRAGRRARPARAPARVRLQALPPLRRRLRLRGRLPRPPRPLRVPELRRPPARPAGARVAGRAARDPLGRFHAHRAGGRAQDRAAAARPLQRLQRARRRRAVPAARRSRSTRSPPASPPSRPPSAAPRRSRWAGGRCRSC